MTIVCGRTVVTVDPERRVIDDGAVALEGDRIVAVGPRAQIEAAYPEVTERIGGTDFAVLPGLIDAHGHAGHSMTKTLGADRPDVWMDVVTPYYFTRTTEEFWYVDGLVAALGRLGCGVTTSMSVLGSRPRAPAPMWPTGHSPMPVGTPRSGWPTSSGWGRPDVPSRTRRPVWSTVSGGSRRRRCAT